MIKHPSSPARIERKSPKTRDVNCVSTPPTDDGLLYVLIFSAHFREQPCTREVPVSNDSQDSITIAPCLKKLCHLRARRRFHSDCSSGFGFQIQDDGNVRRAGFLEKSIHQEPLAVRRYDVLLLLDVYRPSYHACGEQWNRRRRFR